MFEDCRSNGNELTSYQTPVLIQKYSCRYAFSSSYQEVQKKYEECSASHDPNTIVMLVNQHPYHIDSLLTLAEVYRRMGESQRSADLLERCLYALEYAWHPWFNITTGRCRLDYGWDPNKPLFVALFNHMQHLYRRGCHRTALEVCKLLLSLDPDDPMGSIFCIDYFAIRAEQYKWLQRFVREYGADRSLSLLPNFSYAFALAQFHVEAQGSASSSARYFHNSNSSANSEYLWFFSCRSFLMHFWYQVLLDTNLFPSQLLFIVSRD
jgi:tetratricopeptide (TPR) repeat protein